jgi:hypothetical protein
METTRWLACVSASQRARNVLIKIITALAWMYLAMGVGLWLLVWAAESAWRK